MRIKRSVTARAKHKKTLASTKGMQHSRRASFRLGKQAVIRALQYAYRDRRNRKREFRVLWTQRINAAARLNGTSYSKLISQLSKADIQLNRKMLSEISISMPSAFSDIVKASSAKK